MAYTLNSIDLYSYGISAIQSENTNLAITGGWDMPSRTGKCFHDWGESFEPYVSPSELRYGGRDVVFTGMIKKESENAALRSLYNLYQDIESFDELVPFHADGYGDWDVYIKEEINAQYLGNGLCRVVIRMRQPVVDLSGIIPAPTNAALGIDGISFKDLGIALMEYGSSWNRPATLDGNFTAYVHEGYQVRRAKQRDVSFKFLMVRDDFNGFLNGIKSLYALFSKPGLRYITIQHDALRSFFVQSGFSVTQLYENANRVTAVLEIRVTEASSHLDWSFLQDHLGNEITDHNGQKIIIT